MLEPAKAGGASLYIRQFPKVPLTLFRIAHPKDFDHSKVPTAYDKIAGQSLERLAALSDGIFAVAMTLLVLDLHVPGKEADHNLWSTLAHTVGPQIIVYLMSFITLGIFWVGQQTQLNHLERSQRSLTWIHIFFLFAVTLTPFSTRLLAEFMTNRVALLIYWLNILLLGVTLYFSWMCASNLGLVKADMPPDIPKAIQGRILVGQLLYACGAALCFFSTYLSIAFIVVVQLNYTIAPRLFGRK
jgi:uncharacterized membrane protein